jgi:hypothetical protein
MRNRVLTTTAAVFAVAFLLAAFVPQAQACIQVITFAEDPATGECVAFPNPCVVPDGWETCSFGLAATQEAPVSQEQPMDGARATADIEFCAQVITFAEDPETGECIAFPTPCDVPDGWEDCGPGPIGF